MMAGISSSSTASKSICLTSATLKMFLWTNNLSEPFFEGSCDVSDDGDDFLDEADIRRYLSIPFMHKVAKYHGNQGIEFEIDCGRACECRKHLVEWFMCRWTEDLQNPLEQHGERGVLCG